ncbi:DUF4397 domain-containing protein [Sphingobacterium hotanense]|uniref:DUF4397 domain-containing protein n=1 Tax=Sphingobacterium hotanense TaxID=649196 RepID=UPI0011F23A97|nr:DUF4397 domain-containing protein [Sphingobacterium hotanense]
MNFLRNAKLFSIALLSAFFLISCQKDSVGDLALDAPSFSGIAGFNAVYRSLGLDLKIDDRVINSDEYFDMGGAVKHKSVFPGRRSISLYDKDKKVEVFRGEHLVDPGKVYSAFFYGKDNVQMKVVEDNMIAPSAGKAKIRIANFANNRRIDFKVKEGQTATAGDKVLSAQEVTTFYEFNAEKVRFQFENESEFSQMSIEFKPKDRGVYTVFLIPRIVSNVEGISMPDYEIQVIEHN